jgi:hypothetical protein
MSQSKDIESLALTEPQAWAAAELELQHVGTLDSARVAWLHKLQRNDFLSGIADREAAMMLFEAPHDASAAGSRLAAQPALIPPGADDIVAERYLAAQIERFARHFFSIPVVSRRLHWHDFQSRTLQFPAIQNRLSALRPCLELETPQLPDVPAKAAPLYAELERMFVLRPSQRALARRAVLELAIGEPEPWGQAARWLRRKPSIAALDAELLRILADWKELGKYRNVRRFFRAPEARVKKETHRIGRSIWIGCVLFAVLINFLIMAVDKLSKSQTKPPVRAVDLGPPYNDVFREQLRNRPHTPIYQPNE